MAKTLINVTDQWQEAATVAAIFTIDSVGFGTLYFNDAEDDTTAYKVAGQKGDQFKETKDKTTYVKASGSGWFVIADTD